MMFTVAVFGVLLIIVMFLWVQTLGRLAALQRDYENKVKLSWAKAEELAQLKKSVLSVPVSGRVGWGVFPEPEKPQRIFTRCPACGNDTLTVNDDLHLLCTWHACPDPTAIDRAHQRYTWKDQPANLPPVVLLPEVPAGVDTAAQVPNTLCRHCGRPLSGHGMEYNQCLPTLGHHGELTEYPGKTYEPKEGEFFSTIELREVEEQVKGRVPKCEQCGKLMRLLGVIPGPEGERLAYHCPPCNGEESLAPQDANG